MGKMNLEDLEAREQELNLAEKKLKMERQCSEDEIENLTKRIEKYENGKDWKTLSSEVIEQNNRLRNRIWELIDKKNSIDAKIIAIHEEIRLINKSYSSIKFKEKSLEIDEKLGLIVVNQNLRKDLKSLVTHLSTMSDKKLNDFISNPELRTALKTIKSIVIE